MSESFCLDILKSAKEMAQSGARQVLRMCFSPQDPLWENPIPAIDCDTFRLNGISLRFYSNSSSLWRFRSLIAVSLLNSSTFVTELSILKELSGFKSFNYHLFNYFLNLSLHPSFRDHSELFLNTLVDQAVRDPSNFSPLHILLVGLTSQRFSATLFFPTISRLLDRTPSEALIEFSVSLCLLPDVPESVISRCRNIIPDDSPFSDLLV